MRKKVRRKPRRIISAPELPMVTVDSPVPCGVVSVDLEPNEEVGWIWHYLPNGQSYVSGYIVKRARRQSRGLR